MCEIFMSVPEHFYKRKNKSIRLNGLATSLTLEGHFWYVLEQIGAKDGFSLGRLCSKLYDEFVQTHGVIDNLGFSSFLRVCCLRYLNLLAIGAIPKDASISIGSLTVDKVLAVEKLN